jgi:glycosyltransferase involved in cell wall biosynthesis
MALSSTTVSSATHTDSATVPTTLGATILIPAYNEEDGIGPVLHQLNRVMGDSGIEYEILVVDDGSRDKTAEVVRGHDVQLVQHSVNRGYGAALKTGLRRAKHELIVITDADGTYPNERIPALIGEMRDCDMVVGARTGENTHVPLVRRPAKWFITRLAESISGSVIPDLNSGLRVFRKSLAIEFYHLFPQGFSFTTTITLAMLSNDYRVKFIPIDYHARVGSSKIRPVRDTANFVHLILRTVMYFAPLRIFLRLAILLFTASIVVGAYSLLVLGRLMDVTVVVLAVAGLQAAMTGMLADLVDKRIPRGRL